MEMMMELGLITTIVLIAVFSLHSSKVNRRDEDPVVAGGMIKWKL